MNHDDNKPGHQAMIDPELEARVVAWVSGEASAFEVAELERLTAGKPELAIFKRRIEAVRGLVGEALRPDKEPLLMSTERRAKLLQAIGAPENTGASETAGGAAILSPPAAMKARRVDRRWLYAIAACLMVGFVSVLSVSRFQESHEMEPERQIIGRVAEGRNPGPDLSVSLPTVSSPEPATINESLDGLRDADSMPRERAMKFAMSLADKKKVEQLARREITQRMAEKQAAEGRKARGSNLVARNLPPGAFTDAAPVRAGAGQVPRGFADYARPDAIAASGAQNTLAGTRVRTEVSNVASASSVVTDQFLKDTGAGNSQNPLAYTRGTEVGGLRGNFIASAAAPAGKGGALAQNAAPAPGTDLEIGSPVSSGGKVAASSDADVPPVSEADEKAVVLSPFIVEAKESDGCTATSTLAGTRLAPALKPADDVKMGNKLVELDLPSPAPAKTEPGDQETPEVSAAKDPVSTFSLHVSDVSFRLAQAALAKDETVDEESIRPEEFYNAFDYGDPAPAMAEKVSCRIEQAAHPFLQQRNLVRIAIKVPATGRDAAQPLRLTVLLDTSGSMEREDRAATAHRAMQALVSLLGPNDRLTLIGFARQPRLLAESLTGDQAGQALDIIAHTPAEGGTNLEEALKLGRELAHRQFESTAQNRVVLLTDGAANLGNADPAQLASAIEALRQEGIAFDACGVGLDGLDDAMLERLTRKGAGRYYVLNSPDDADAGFARQLAGAFHPAAENVKLQVRFNPARVGNYRLIGFEQHRLREEDFRNDSVGAAALAAEEAAVAVYQVESLPQGEGELGEVYVRFRDAASGTMVERSWTMAFDPHAPAFDHAAPTIQLAGTAALLAEKMRGGEAGDAVKLSELAPVVNQLHIHYANEPRVQELVTMFGQLRRRAGE